MEDTKEKSSSEFKLEKLQDTQKHLEAITTYIDSHPEQFASVNSFTYITDPQGNTDITIITPDGDKRISEFLPKEVSIVDSPNSGAGAYALTSWDLEGNLAGSSVSVDLAWMKEKPAQGASIVAHEIGHVINESAKEDLDQRKITEAPETPEELEESLMLVCRVVNDGLQDEVEAWNYGKPIANLFGVDETTYDSQMEYSMKAYTNTSYYQINEMMANMLMHLTPDQKQTLKDKMFPVYDLATQERTDLTIDQMTEKFKTFNKERSQTSSGAMVS